LYERNREKETSLSKRKVLKYTDTSKIDVFENIIRFYLILSDLRLNLHKRIISTFLLSSVFKSYQVNLVKFFQQIKFYE